MKDGASKNALVTTITHTMYLIKSFSLPISATLPH